MSKPCTPAGQVIIVSGPSGAGKSTLVRTLLKRCDLPIVLSVSATTRPPRAGEREGVDYHFLSQEEFQKRRLAGEFLEEKEVFGRGDWYGTLASEVTAGLSAGKWVLLEIDVQGAMSVLPVYPDAATFFVHSGTLEELEKRLRDRRSETEASIQRRLEVARGEMDYLTQYRYTIVNETIDEAADEMCRILQSLGEQG
ncbi:guanylate kinase [Lignipirellula cremea]|uniref:Guanylate kinase n=1 Tax=Lignipirellula cremea TaxID=2528010 RepID=A0A518DQY2_9BACT|nr:guanylate kinase [Lignipirellula cremea]QDU94241.1 Guanylate kinase [Lignipirellula cremea]